MKKIYFIFSFIIISITPLILSGCLYENKINEETELIYLDYPQPNEIIKSPLTIKGRARGYWFFEGDFPVILTNWDGLIISEGAARSQGDWMTEDFVPFEVVLEFDNEGAYSNKGSLILRKDNPSGLPEHDDALEINVVIEN